MLVFQRPRTLFVRFNGFADRDTVAQAAANAASSGLVSLDVDRELFVRHARKDGRSVAMMRAVDHGDSCVVEAEVFPAGVASTEPLRPGPYTFADGREATAFVTEAVEALDVPRLRHSAAVAYGSGSFPRRSTQSAR